MSSFSTSMEQYKKQMQKGDIRIAYRGLMDFFTDLKSHLYTNQPDFLISDRIYQGAMDVTFLTFTTAQLKSRKLKLEILFAHESHRFEIWLSGVNKKFQFQYWTLMKERGWSRYPLAEKTDGVLFITKNVIADDPDFSNLDKLKKQLEQGAAEFVSNVEKFVLEH